MPKVNHVKARKDYPEQGIKKGDMYYTWNLMTGPRSSRTYRQLAAPKRSQLTTSEFLKRIYDIEDRISALTDLSDLENIVSDLRELSDDEQGKYDNMSEGLQQGSTGQLIEARATACSDAADAFEAIDTEFDEEEPEDDDEKAEWQERFNSWEEDLLEEIRSASIDYE